MMMQTADRQEKNTTFISLYNEVEKVYGLTNSFTSVGTVSMLDTGTYVLI